MNEEKSKFSQILTGCWARWLCLQVKILMVSTQEQFGMEWNSELNQFEAGKSLDSSMPCLNVSDLVFHRLPALDFAKNTR